MIVDTKTLVSCLTLLRTQGDEVVARPHEGGWRFYSRRADAVTLTDIRMHRDAFEGEMPETLLGIRIDRWLKALRTVGSRADIAVTDDGARVNIRGEGMRHIIPVLACEDTPMRVPELPNTGTAMVSAERVRTLLNVSDATASDACVVMSVSQEGLKVSALDEQGLGSELTVPAENCDILDGQAEAGYPAEAWMSFVKALPAEAVISIAMADDMPATVSFGDKGYDGLWLVAPRVRSE